jgi:hypothetical protein
LQTYLQEANHRESLVAAPDESKRDFAAHDFDAANVFVGLKALAGYCNYQAILTAFNYRGKLTAPPLPRLRLTG